MITTAPVEVEAPKNYINAEYGLKSWLLTQDHKRIAILYLISITFFFFIGGIFAALIRLELATPAADLVESNTYNKLFTMHGIIMIFLFLMPSIPATLGNFLIPPMIGAKDLAFPKINLLSWYIYIIGGLLTLYVLVTGGVDTGWTFYTPFSSTYSNSYVIATAIAYLHRRLLLDSYRTQFHRHHPPHARSGHDLVPPAALRLGALRHQPSSDSGHAGAGCNSPAAGARARPAHRHLRPRAGRRPGAVPASLLVLLASGRLHHDSARPWA